MSLNKSKMHCLKVWPSFFTREELVKICPTANVPLEGTPFTFFFEPILTELEGYYWLTDAEAFIWPDEWDKTSEYSEESKEYVTGPLKLINELHKTIKQYEWDFKYGQPGIMPTYSIYVKNDWNFLYAFKEPVSHPVAWCDNYYLLRSKGGNNLAKFLEGTLELCLVNIDGAYWVLCTRNNHLIEKVKNHMEPYKEFTLSDIPLIECCSAL